jgi:hypothetical protein
LPQHDPGPAHPASDTERPQQAVSPGPGTACGVLPVKELGVDINRVISALSHWGHATDSLPESTNVSP